MSHYAQEESQRRRGTDLVRSDSLAGWEKGLQGTGEVYGDVGFPTGGSDWAGQDIPLIACLLGGIIQQLLESELQRLNEVEECVVWYERERDIAKSRVEKLKQLQALARRGNEPDESTNLETNE
ncbi:MAG: hypothetical protein VKK42_03395 [Lyngbya sp.]|nr:hypothetical protein [Lyngbya sp.]